MTQDPNKPYEPPSYEPPKTEGLNLPPDATQPPSYAPPAYGAPSQPAQAPYAPPAYGAPSQPASFGLGQPTPPGSFEPGAPGYPVPGANVAAPYATNNPWAVAGDAPGQTATSLVRFLGYLIDAILLGIVNNVIDLILPASASGLVTLLQVVVSAAYFIVLNGQGQTVGKMIMKTKVVDMDNGQAIGYSRAALRYLMYIVMALPLLLGFLSIPLNTEKRGWGDQVAKTRVIKVG